MAETTQRYAPGRVAAKLLGVHSRTLYQWEERSTRSEPRQRLYDVEKFLRMRNHDDVEHKMKIVYVRVSSIGQKDDLERQKQVMVAAYPGYEIIEDIGSGVNFNRRGFKKIITLAIDGKIGEVVVAYKDRFTRFGFEFFEGLIKEYSGGKITVVNEKEDIEPEEELVRDVMQIMNVFTAKMNGLRKYRKNHDDEEES